MAHELHYYNSRGKRIDRRMWERLLRTRGYGNPRWEIPEGKEWMVRLSWVGVASKRETEPRIWLVETIRLAKGKGGARSEDLAAPVWCRTYEEALGVYEQSVAVMQG